MLNRFLMKIISTSYSKTEEYSDPKEWLQKISFYTGILEELSRQHEVISFERINYEGGLKYKCVQYYFIKLQRKVVRFPSQMHSLIKQFQPDVVFVNGSIFPLQVIQLRLKLGRKVKIIILHRAERPFTGIKRYLQKLADQCVNSYLFSSIEFRDAWKRNIDVKKMHEIMQASSGFCPADRSLAREITNANGDPVFLWVGRLEENKDPLTVVKAFIEFLHHQPSAVLYMIYQTNELFNIINGLVERNNAGSSIRLIGKVQHPQLQDWYNSADLIISGSHYEGGGTVITEAMSCGCIPVVTDISSFRALTANGKCGFLYKAGNEGDLLTTLLQTREIDIKKEKEKVLCHFNDQLSFEAIGRKINAIIS